MLVGAPIRIYFGGGLEGTTIVFMTSFTVYALIMLDRPYRGSGAVLCLLNLAIFKYIEVPEFTTSLESRSIIYSATTLVIFWLLKIALDEKSKLLKFSEKLERENMANRMVGRLSHKLNNPLAVIKAELELARKKQDLQRLDKVVTHVNRMAELIKTLNSHASENELGEYIIENEKSIYLNEKSKKIS